MSNNSIWPIDRTLFAATSPSMSEPGSSGNERVLCIPQSSSITGVSVSEWLMSCTGHSLWEVLPLYKASFGVFYSPSQQGEGKMCIILTLDRAGYSSSIDEMITGHSCVNSKAAMRRCTGNA